MYTSASVKLPAHIHILVYQHLTYTRQSDGHYSQQLERDSVLCGIDERLDHVIPGLSYCPTLDVYAVKDHAPNTFEFYVVEIDSAERSA